LDHRVKDRLLCSASGSIEVSCIKALIRNAQHGRQKEASQAAGPSQCAAPREHWRRGARSPDTTLRPAEGRHCGCLRHHPSCLRHAVRTWSILDASQRRAAHAHLRQGPSALCPCRTRKLLLLSGPDATAEGHAATIRALAFDPAGRHLLAGDDAKLCRVWDLSTGVCCQTMCVLLIACHCSASSTACGALRTADRLASLCAE